MLIIFYIILDFLCAAEIYIVIINRILRIQSILCRNIVIAAIIICIIIVVDL